MKHCLSCSVNIVILPISSFLYYYLTTPFFVDYFSLFLGSKDGLSKTTEWILIGCLGAFGLMFIAIIILVVQIIRLNKSVNNLKITSSR